MLRPSPGPSWTVLEPPNTSPAPTPRSDPTSDLGDDEEDNFDTPPGKRKAIESPVSVPRPQKLARFNDNDHREKRAEVLKSGKPTNGTTPSSLTQPPEIAKVSRSSFLSQPVRPEKGKVRASSGQSSSSLSDHISTMLQKQNARLNRTETARKTARKTTASLRVSTSHLIRAVQKPSSSSEVSSAATRVRRVSARKFPHGRPPPRNVIELTDSSGSARRRRTRGDDPIIISSSDADTPPRHPQPSQTPISRKTGPKRPPPPDAEVICISDSDDDNVTAPLPATAVLPNQDPSPALPSPSPIVVEPETEIMVDLEHQVPEDSYYEPMEPESNFDDELARSELQRQTEELFSYIDLDPREPDFADQSAGQIAHDDCNAAQDPHVPTPDMLTDSTLPSSKQTSSGDTLPVEITPQRIVFDTHYHLESSSGSEFSISAPEVPSQTLATAPITAKPSIAWNYTPPTTNPFFARALAFNAKALKKPLPLVAQVSNEPNATSSFAAPTASPAIVGSSTANMLSKPLVDQQTSDAPMASSSSVPSPWSIHLLPHDGDGSVFPPLADEVAADIPQQLSHPDSRDDAASTCSDQPSIRNSTAMKVPISMSDIPTPAPVAPSSSVPVPPRVQRPAKRLSLTELINKRREEHFRSHPSGGCIDLTDDVSPPSSGSNQVPSMSIPQESVQPPHNTYNNASSLPALVSARQPAPTVETRTPSIQEIRDLMRQRPSSSKLSISSAASNPSVSSAASATSALVPNISPPRSITSNSTSSSNQSGSISSSSRKKRSMGMASLEMFISPIPDEFQPASTKKTTPLTVKRTSCNTDVFRRIITPTAEISVRSPSLSPSEGRRTRRLVRPPSPQGIGAGADDAAAQPHDQSRALPEPFENPGVTSTTSPFVIPAEEEMEVQSACAHEDVPLLDDVIDDMPPSEGLQGVTESIGSLDLHEHSRSPEVDINVNQAGILPTDIICEDGYLEGIPVSAELMEDEMLVDDVSAESVEKAPVPITQLRDVDEEDGGVDMKGKRVLAARKKTRSMSMGVSGDSDEECRSVLMQLEALDGEAGDADHPISINSSRTVSSHTSSRQLSQSPAPTGSLGVAGVVDGGDATSVKRLEDGVEYYMGGYPVVTWNSYSQAQRLLPPKYRLAKDLPHELQDRVNALPQSYRDSPQASVLFEAMIDEAIDDEHGAPPISIINEVTDEGAPPWEFVYTNQMWYGEDVPPPDIQNLKSCDCVGRCDPKSKKCGCAKRQYHHLKRYIANKTIPDIWHGRPFMYDSKGTLQFFGMPIFECNDFCGCDEDCPNRVVQRGRRYAISIKRTEFKGWGVFNGPKRIPKGSFIGIYAGELLTVEESDRRGVLYNKFGRTYLFDIDFHHMGAEATYSVDAYHAGNFTRFLNHSCDPNCEIHPCYINEANIEKPLLTVFTRLDVEPFEELCFSYLGCIDDDAISKAKNAKKNNDAVYAECHCGSANCLGVLFS